MPGFKVLGLQGEKIMEITEESLPYEFNSSTLPDLTGNWWRGATGNMVCVIGQSRTDRNRWVIVDSHELFLMEDKRLREFLQILRGGEI